jgi:hypothetical protein
MKHTPGPWTVERGHDGRIGRDGRIRDVQVTIALVTRGVDLDPDDDLGGPTFEANARLIAAAPELLAALKTLFDDYKRLADSGDCGFWKLEDQSSGQQALAAIAKAEGQS